MKLFELWYVHCFVLVHVIGFTILLTIVGCHQRHSGNEEAAFASTGGRAVVTISCCLVCTQLCTLFLASFSRSLARAPFCRKHSNNRHAVCVLIRGKSIGDDDQLSSGVFVTLTPVPSQSCSRLLTRVSSHQMRSVHKHAVFVSTGRKFLVMTINCCLACRNVAHGC